MESPKTRVTLEYSSKVAIFLDTSIEINLMTREVIEDIALAIQYGQKLELISHNSHSYLFLDLCKILKFW